MVKKKKTREEKIKKVKKFFGALGDWGRGAVKTSEGMVGGNIFELPSEGKKRKRKKRR